MCARVAGLVIDRAEEQGGVGIGNVVEGRRLVVESQLTDARGSALERSRGAPYHQTVESSPSSSSTGVV